MELFCCVRAFVSQEYILLIFYNDVTVLTIFQSSTMLIAPKLRPRVSNMVFLVGTYGGVSSTDVFNDQGVYARD